MNWYKKAKNYGEIGHKGTYILWYSPDGQRIINSPPQKHKPNTSNGLRHNNWEDWRNDASISPYRGRYDTITKEISVVGVGFSEAPKSLINSLMRSFPDVRTIYIFNSYDSHETIRVASKKIAQRGEWWIIDSQAVFADSDVGEMGHEGYVIDAIQRKYAYNEFDKGEWIDWDGFKKELAMEEYEEQYGKRPTEESYQQYKDAMEDLYLKKLKEMGITDEEYAIAEGIGDARAYGMEHLGWKRVAGNNVQTQTLTTYDLKQIADGLYDINNDLDENSDVPFNIEVVSTGAFYTDVPYKLISDRAPSMMRQYQNVYAKKKGWYKI